MEPDWAGLRYRPVLDGALQLRLRAARHQLEPHDELGTHWATAARRTGPR